MAYDFPQLSHMVRAKEIQTGLTSASNVVVVNLHQKPSRLPCIQMGSSLRSSRARRTPAELTLPAVRRSDRASSTRRTTQAIGSFGEQDINPTSHCFKSLPRPHRIPAPACERGRSHHGAAGTTAGPIGITYVKWKAVFLASRIDVGSGKSCAGVSDPKWQLRISESVVKRRRRRSRCSTGFCHALESLA